MFQTLLADSPGAAPLRDAIRACRWHLLFAAGFSALVNVLYLAPTLYMMQIYDRVVPTGGLLTLAFVTAVVVFALATLAALDHIRARLLIRASLRIDRLLAGPVMERLVASPLGGVRVRQAMREFDHARAVIGGAGALALCDAPWTPIYLLFCFILHPALGALTLAGVLILLGLAVLNERATRPRLQDAARAAAGAYAAQEAIAGQADVVRALGMRRALVARQLEERGAAIGAQAGAQLSGGRYSGAIRFMRLLLQSLALGLGGWLAVEGQITAGAIIAASVLLSRAVHPIEQLVGSWAGIVQARSSLKVLTDLFAQTSALEQSRTELPAPTGRLDVEAVTVRAPDSEALLLKRVGFSLQPGQSLGVIGPSGAGKTTLARLLAGAATPAAGAVRLDGADYAVWDPERLARHIGYLPQDSALFAGTVRDNISRFAAALGEDPARVDAAAVAAAQAAGVHELILRLPHGYDTRLGPGGQGLSAGQAQRIALARALYGDPSLLVLDEPNSHLDQEGEAALMRAVRQAGERGATVVMIAHRAGVLSTMDQLLVLKDGAVAALGPHDEVAAALQPRGKRPRVVGAPG